MVTSPAIPPSSTSKLPMSAAAFLCVKMVKRWTILFFYPADFTFV